MRTRSFIGTGWMHIAAQAALPAILYAVGRDRPLVGSELVRHLGRLILVGLPSAIWSGFF